MRIQVEGVPLSGLSAAQLGSQIKSECFTWAVIGRVYCFCEIRGFIIRLNISQFALSRH